MSFATWRRPVPRYVACPTSGIPAESPGCPDRPASNDAHRKLRGFAQKGYRPLQGSMEEVVMKIKKIAEPPPAGAQPICGGQISLFGLRNDDGEAYSQYSYALEPVCADMAWSG